ADGRRYELHDGELLVTAAPSVSHQRVVGRLFALLRQHVETHALGEVFVSPLDCILSETTVVQPDLIFLDSARSSLATARVSKGLRHSLSRSCRAQLPKLIVAPSFSSMRDMESHTTGSWTPRCRVSKPIR